MVVAVSGGGADTDPLDLDVVMEVRGGVVEAEARVLVGFPHWYYGMRGANAAARVASEAGGGPVPATVRPGEFGRWYAQATTDRVLPEGTRWTLTVRGAPPVQVPGELVPLVLFDPQGGDDPLPVPVAAGVVLAPSERPPSGERRGTWSTKSGRRVVFADLHGHSELSDGRGSPRSYFSFARTRGRVQVAALSDHDWQLTAAEFADLLDAADAANVPGEFVALPGLETNLHGHEVVWFFSTQGLRERKPGADGGARTIWRETDFGAAAATFQPPAADLMLRLRDTTLSATHTSLAPGMGTPFPRPSPLPGGRCIEIYSAHGSSECFGCERTVADRPGGPDDPISSVRAHLKAEPTLCLIAAGDSHDGRPGATRWGPHPGGLTGLEIRELNRRGVHDAMLGGYTWATTGERMVLELDGGGRKLRIQAAEPTGEVRIVDVDRDAERILARGDARGRWIDLPALRAGYVRVHLLGGGMGWINPNRP